MTEQPAGRPLPDVYPGAPLRAVAIEVYFKSLLDSLERFGRFQREHDEEYPRVYFPDDAETPLPRRRATATLVHKDGERAIAVGRGILGVVTFRYPGFDEFSSWALPLLREVIDVLAPSRIDRVRYVYENVIEVPKGEGVAIDDYFNIRLPRGEEAKAGVQHLHLGWNQPWPLGLVDVRLDSCATSMDEGQMELTITAERSSDGPMALSALEAAIDDAHRMGRLTFEALITPGYRERLRKRPEA